MNSTAMTTKHSYRAGRVVALAAAIAALSAPIVSVTSTGAAAARMSATPAAAAAHPAAAPVSPAAASLRRATVAIDLCGDAGTASAPLPATLQVWGYTLDATCAAAVTKPGGPVIDVSVGDLVTINLHNGLALENTSLLIQGQPAAQPMPPDLVGVAPGMTATYTFTAANPGTYLYEAGFGADGNTQHQVAMGLYGALVVRPAGSPLQAYGASTAFDDEGVLVLGEIDPALNNRTDANKLGFDMRNFKPKYFTVNGNAYPAGAPIATDADSTVLLRYVNAGMSYHSMAVLGASQQIIAYHGNPLTYPHTVAAETFGPGQTADALVEISAAATAGTNIAVYDGSLLLNNSNTAGFGGMMTFINVVTGGVGGPDITGPSTTGLSAAPNPTNTFPVALSATLSDVTSGGSNVTAAEYFIDVAGANGAGIAMSGSFGSPTAAVNASIAAATNGTHTIYVHGLDSLGNWGALNSVALTVDTVGPVTSSLTLTPSTTSGAAVAVHAAASDVTTGGQNVTAGEYTIDGGTPIPITVMVPAATVSLDATISAATVASLSDGAHTIAVRSRDSLGNWSTLVPTAVLTKNTGGPTMTVNPDPVYSNGVVGYNSSTPAARVVGVVTSIGSNVAAAEGFLPGQAQTPGTGFTFLPVDGNWNQTVESVYADIPLTTINTLPLGNNVVSVHGKNALGIWGAVFNATLLIDKEGPTVSGLSATPQPAGASVTIGATVDDNPAVNSGVSRVEWFMGADPGLGLANAMTLDVTPANHWSSASIDTSNLASGFHTVSVRARDGAQNWSTIQTISVLVTRGDLRFSTLGNTNPPGAAGTADDADIYLWSGSNPVTRELDVTTITNPLPGGANVDGFDRVSATQFYVSFSGGVTIALPGPNLTVQDEDVLYYNAGAWSVFFDGSANGLGGTDLDEIAVVGGSLYFSTDDNDLPPGAGGAGDNADIYRWNGGSSYTRVINASGGGSIGLPGGANIDGLDIVGSTYYFSFVGDTVVPGLGTVQDEDVVTYNAGVWTLWFDGTSLGLTSANLDLDAIDV